MSIEAKQTTNADRTINSRIETTTQKI